MRNLGISTVVHRTAWFVSIGLVFFYFAMDHETKCVPELSANAKSLSNSLFQHPLDIVNAREVVADLRVSKSVPISPINTRYTNIKYLEGSMACSTYHAKIFSILILIKTRPSEVALRAKARRVLRNETVLANLGAYIQYGFLIGQPHENITTEIQEQNDFVIGDFEDTYRNLTYKSMMGFRWAIEQCPDFDFFVSLDVDTHIFLNNLVGFLKDPYNYPDVNPGMDFERTVSSRVDFFAGRVLSNRVPDRKLTNYYYMSKEEYASPVFPPFIAGMLIILSKETVTNFYYLSPYVQHIYIDDAYYGILAQKLGIVPFDISSFVFDGLFMHKLSHPLEFYLKGGLNQVLSVHHLEAVERFIQIY